MTRKDTAPAVSVNARNTQKTAQLCRFFAFRTPPQGCPDKQIGDVFAFVRQALFLIHMGP